VDQTFAEIKHGSDCRLCLLRQNPPADLQDAAGAFDPYPGTPPALRNFKKLLKVLKSVL
jgi:hypothetical protein